MGEGTPPAAIFLNEGSSSARTNRVQAAVALTRRALDADLHILDSSSPDELRAWLAERIPGYTTAVVVGGDGTLGLAYNVAAPLPEGQRPVLGYIPAGFGNATAHLLNLPSHPAALAGLLARGASRPVDLVSVDGRLALFAGAGWDAVVAGRYAAGRARRLPGWGRAVLGSLGELHRRFRVRVEVDGTLVHEGPMALVVASTTPFYGRGLLVNPGARTDAGRMTLRVYPGPEPRLALEAVRWAAHRRPSAVAFPALAAVVTSLDGGPIPVQADGDLMGESAQWHVAVCPAAVRLIGRW